MVEGNQDGRVVVVTGGGGGIGTVTAVELASRGATVVALDPGIGVTGELLGERSAEATVAQIAAAGGTGHVSLVSVTDRDGLRDELRRVASDLGSLDAVVNTAGILRFAQFPVASEEDWRVVLETHVDGYINVLEAALPIMVDAGYGRIVGFTSGAGLARSIIDGAAYGCAKRIVASLTWELRGALPDGVRVNALSPIAATRMVREALIASGVDRDRGLDLTAMPQAEDMAPAAAYLAGPEAGWLSGRVVYSAGPELSAVFPPRLLEAVRTDGVGDVASALGTLVPVVLGPVEADQRTSGGSNPRFGPVFDAAPPAGAPAGGEAPGGREAPGRGPTCVIVADDEALAEAVDAGLASWGMAAVGIGPWKPVDDAASRVARTFADATAALTRVTDGRQVDALVVALSGVDDAHRSIVAATPTWQEIVGAHREVVPHVVGCAAWLRAAADHVARTGRPVRVVFVNPATTAAGRTSAQAVAQMSRSANETPTMPRVETFSVALESDAAGDREALGHLVARLASADDALALRGAELAVRPGWIALRSHPGPMATISYGGGAVPAWADDALRDAFATGDG